MCDTIRMKNGNDIETVEQFEKHFNVNADNLKYDYYDKLSRDSCLCQIDLEKFMSNKHDFEYDCGDWWEV